MLTSDNAGRLAQGENMSNFCRDGASVAPHRTPHLKSCRCYWSAAHRPLDLFPISNTVTI